MLLCIYPKFDVGYYVCIAVLTLDAGLLAGSQYPEGPATGHLDTGFSWFPCVYKRMLRWFPSFQVATTCLSCSPPDLNFLGLFLQPTLMHNSITTCMPHYYPRHVSGLDMPILRRNNSTNTASGILALLSGCTLHRLRAESLVEEIILYYDARSKKHQIIIS